MPGSVEPAAIEELLSPPDCTSTAPICIDVVDGASAPNIMRDISGRSAALRAHDVESISPDGFLLSFSRATLSE